MQNLIQTDTLKQNCMHNTHTKHHTRKQPKKALIPLGCSANFSTHQFPDFPKPR